MQSSDAFFIPRGIVKTEALASEEVEDTTARDDDWTDDAVTDKEDAAAEDERVLDDELESASREELEIPDTDEVELPREESRLD
ncbi:MAG TPA: hypothetical protein PLM00_08630 [Spirochaetota bacterium]|nr:hypothetical protein [Spirochaetota bacterium]